MIPNLTIVQALKDWIIIAKFVALKRVRSGIGQTEKKLLEKSAKSMLRIKIKNVNAEKKEELNIK